MKVSLAGNSLSATYFKIWSSNNDQVPRAHRARSPASVVTNLLAEQLVNRGTNPTGDGDCKVVRACYQAVRP